jgi:hypothetical protein
MTMARRTGAFELSATTTWPLSEAVWGAASLSRASWAADDAGTRRTKAARVNDRVMVNRS